MFYCQVSIPSSLTYSIYWGSCGELHMQHCSCILMIINTNTLLVPQSSQSPHGNSLVHLEDCSEELFRRQSYAIKTQFQHPNPLPTRGFGMQKDPTTLALRWFFMLPLHLKGAYNWTFPCIEANSLRSNTLKSEAPIKFDPRERIK